MLRYDERYLIEMLSYTMIICGIVFFLILCAGYKATYGRYANETHLPDLNRTKFAEQIMNNMFYLPSIPAKWAWLLQELPSLCIPLYYLIADGVHRPLFNSLGLGLFVAHYFNRSLIYPFLIKGSAGTPMHIFLQAVLFCTVNGYIQGAWHSRYAATSNASSSLDVIFCFIGISMYAIGATINITSDSILRNLRKDGQPGSYKIPRGGLFEYVSGANFFGECTEWLGYALFNHTLPAFAFAFFTVCNLSPRAYQHHRWYQQKFQTYPKDRKAIIPFIF